MQLYPAYCILYITALSADIIFCAAGVPRTPPHQYYILDQMFNILELIITAIDNPLWDSTNTYICYVGVNSCDSRRTKIHSMNEGWQFVINAYTVRWLRPFISTLLNSAYKSIHSSLCGAHLKLFTERLRSRFIMCWASSLCCRSANLFGTPLTMQNLALHFLRNIKRRKTLSLCVCRCCDYRLFDRLLFSCKTKMIELYYLFIKTLVIRTVCMFSAPLSCQLIGCLICLFPQYISEMHSLVLSH